MNLNVKCPQSSYGRDLFMTRHCPTPCTAAVHDHVTRKISRLFLLVTFQLPVPFSFPGLTVFGLVEGETTTYGLKKKHVPN